MDTFQYHQPVKIIFGTGVFQQLADLIRLYGNNALLVVGQDKMRSYGILDRAVQIVEESGIKVDVYEGVKPNPTKESVEQGSKLAQKAKSEVIVALGGGSVMDASRAIALAVNHQGDVWDYRLTGSKGITAITEKVLPVITVPTTAGTGSEISPAAIITNNHSKEIIVSPYMFPKIALVDPELTLSLPPDTTAQIGLDALVQSIEAYVSKVANTISDMYALRSIELTVDNLPKVVKNGGDIEARGKMLIAGLLSSKAINLASVGAVHALSDPISARYDVGHGLALSLVFPSVMEANQDANLLRYSNIAALLGENVSAISLEESAAHSVGGVKKFLKEIGLTAKLSDLGISQDDLRQLATEAMNVNMMNNPKSLSVEDVITIYKNAL